jgi:hypothetical protein
MAKLEFKFKYVVADNICVHELIIIALCFGNKIDNITYRHTNKKL